MKIVRVNTFGGFDQLQLVEQPTPQPQAGQVLVRLTSIGMNHADLMARRGEYRISSGEPPFTPGLEAGGIIEALGPGVSNRTLGQRIILSADAPRLAAGGMGGTYRSHYLCPAEKTIPAPSAIPDDQLGTIWLPYLTAWGCLIWKQQVSKGAFVAFPAASSAVALAGAQLVKQAGAITIGLTTSPAKAQAIQQSPNCAYDHLVFTRDAAGQPTAWYKDIKRITQDHGVDVFFDPVAAGAYLDTEIRCLAQHGVVWVYGLLAKPDKVDVTPLIRKHAAIRGWALAELVAAGEPALQAGYQHILDGFAKGVYRQSLQRIFPLDQVRQAHEFMEQGGHVGKLALVP